jgi:hypothetical protein
VTPLAITTATLPDATVGQNYSQTLGASGGKAPYLWTKTGGSWPVGIIMNDSGRITGQPIATGTSTITVKVRDGSNPIQEKTQNLSLKVVSTSTLACMYNGVDYSKLNLCSEQRRPGGCGTSVCAQYVPSIQKYAGGAASVNVLKMFMVVESDCRISAGTATSFGLMQITPSTGNNPVFKRNCGITDSITKTWLQAPANADKSICLGAEIIKSLAAGTCGSEPRNIYAGYNAGPGNCAASTDCRNDKSCSGGTVKRWECPYDNPQKTVCNTGMYETKQGATYVNYCLNNLGY